MGGGQSHATPKTPWSCLAKGCRWRLSTATHPSRSLSCGTMFAPPVNTVACAKGSNPSTHGNHRHLTKFVIRGSHARTNPVNNARTESTYG